MGQPAFCCRRYFIGRSCFSYKPGNVPDKDKKKPAVSELEDVYEMLGRFTPDLLLENWIYRMPY